jgi:tetratricopeptide (TPR) repeat protein
MWRSVFLLTLIASTILPVPAQSEAPPSDRAAETRALVQRLVLDHAASIASERRISDEREDQLFKDLVTKDRKLRAEQKIRKEAQADLEEVASALAAVTAERQHLVEEIAARDREFAVEIGEYGERIASIADSPDPRKREALKRYAEGDRITAFGDLVSIQEELDKANDRASAAGWRELGALALDLKDRGEQDTNTAIGIFEKAQRKDPEDAWGWIALWKLYREAGRLTDARHAAEQVITQAQDDREQAAGEMALGDVLVAWGDLKGARTRFEKSLEITKRRAVSDPSSVDIQSDHSVSLFKLGEVLIELGDLDGASDRFEDSLKILEPLAASNPKSSDVQRNYGIVLSKLGEVLVLSGNLIGARTRFEASLKILETLVASSPNSADAQRDLSVGQNKLGEVLVQLYDPAGALPHFEKSFEIRARLAKANQSSALAKRDLSVSLNRLGNVLVATGKSTAARDRFKESVEIRKQLAEEDPNNAEAQSDLSGSLAKLGNVLITLNELPEASACFKEILKIRERLPAAVPDSEDDQRNLGYSLDQLGDALVAAGDLNNARDWFNASLEILKRLAALNPDSVENQRDVIVSHTKLGNLPGGERHWSEALSIARYLQGQGRLAPSDAWMIDELQKRVTDSQEAKP